MARRWYQFSLKSLMAAVVVICLGLGGWHLLWTKGQYVEAEPAVVGQPIKIRGRFFRFLELDPEDCWYALNAIHKTKSGISSTTKYGHAPHIGYWTFEIEHEYIPDCAGEVTLRLTPSGGSPIRGSFVVRGAE